MHFAAHSIRAGRQRAPTVANSPYLLFLLRRESMIENNTIPTTIITATMNSISVTVIDIAADPPRRIAIKKRTVATLSFEPFPIPSPKIAAHRDFNGPRRKMLSPSSLLNTNPCRSRAC
jgi:hypothetical protein